MKCNNLKYGVLAVALAMGVSACDNFLDRPTIDNYNTSNYYETDDQCISGVNYLYNSPWYDFQRGFIKVGEVLSGNYYWGSSPYLTFTVQGQSGFSGGKEPVHGRMLDLEGLGLFLPGTQLRRCAHYPQQYGGIGERFLQRQVQGAEGRCV